LVTYSRALQLVGQLDGEIQTALRRAMLIADSPGARSVNLNNEFSVVERLVVSGDEPWQEWVAQCPEETVNSHNRDAEIEESGPADITVGTCLSTRSLARARFQRARSRVGKTH